MIQVNFSLTKLIRLLGLWGFISAAIASDLDVFLANSKTLRANFSQTIITGNKSRSSSGTMEISRPNKFRWEYTQDKTLIVSDATKIYIYDQPLQQVTVKKLGASLDKSPAAVLAGGNDIYSHYRVSPAQLGADGLSWFKIIPQQPNDNNGFQQVSMGFAANHHLSAMQFIDNFGNQTSLKFTNVQTGISLPNSDFKFVIPAGVDVAE